MNAAPEIKLLLRARRKVSTVQEQRNEKFEAHTFIIVNILIGLIFINK